MPTGMPQPAPGAPPLAFGAGVPLPIIDCTVRRTRIRRVLRVEAVPPEEFLIAREARVVAKSRYVCHRTNPMVGELVARGYDFDTVARYAALDTEDGTSTKTDEAQQRNKGLKTGTPDTTQDISTWRVPHDEHWVRVDTDGDGIAELHRICTVGPECNDICYDEQEADIPFAILSAVRLPHAAIGYAISDQTIDLQDIKTSVLRSILDSLAQSIFPRTAVVENAVTMDDVLNNEVGAVIRMQAPGMVQPLAEPFIGPQALQVMNYLDEMRAQRTGISRQSQGLDANVLQSTTKTAVSASVEAQQDRVELIARTFAELGVKDVFRGVLRYVIRHQDKPRVVRLRNQWVEVDPRFWDAEMDVSVNVGLGRGTNEQRMAFLGMIGAKQEQVLQMLGPSNPIVSIGQLRETYAEMLRIAGFKNPDRFFKTVTPEQEKQLQEQMAQNKPPDPNQLLAETENNKTKQKQQSDTAQRTFDREKALLDDDFRRDQLDADILLRAAEIAAKYGASVDVAEIRAALERDRNAMQLRHQMAMQDRQNEADAGIASQQGQVQRDVASTRANQQIRTGLMREALRAPPMTLPGGNGAAGPAQAQRTMGGIPADGGPA
jgi:hypothetical protein